MVIDDDDKILGDAEIQYLKTNIKNTILSCFRINVSTIDISSMPTLWTPGIPEPDMTCDKMHNADHVSMDYIRDGKLYIEDTEVIDRLIVSNYKKLKSILKDHYAVKKYTRAIEGPFKSAKVYHFIIENFSTYYDFYLTCHKYSKQTRPETHCYTKYELLY